MRGAGGKGVGTLTGVLVLALALCPVTGRAAGDAQRLLSNALLSLDQGNLEAAERDASAALAEEPALAEALYVRGIARMRAQRYAEAAADLRAALDADPHHEAARVSLGYALYRSGRLDEGAAVLEQADERSPLAGQALFTSGLIGLERGEPEKASASFSRAGKLDPSLAPSASYYRGVCAERLGDREEARARLEEARDAAGAPALADAASRRLQALESTHERPYVLYGSVGFEYDSNVALVTDDGALQDAQLSSVGITDESDGRSTIVAGATYMPGLKAPVALAIGYELFQSLHFDLDEFDMLDNRLAAALDSPCGPLTCGLGASYDYYLRDTESFLGEAAVGPYLRRHDERWGDSEIYYRFRDRTFHGTHFDLTLDDLRDGTNHAVGLRHQFALSGEGRDLGVGYVYDHDEADNGEGSAFDYDGHALEAWIDWALPARIGSSLGYAYKFEDYDDDSDGREDDEHHVALELRRPILDHFAVVGGYSYTLNDSNQDAFHYDRHLGSVALEASY